MSDTCMNLFSPSKHSLAKSCSRQTAVRLVGLCLCFLLLSLRLLCHAAEASNSLPLLLKWDSLSKSNHAKIGEFSTRFDFSVVNVSSTPVEVQDVTTSCGCTVASLPEKPWKLRPGATNHLPVLVDLRGKSGTLFKEIKIVSQSAPETLRISVEIEPGVATNAESKEMMDRAWAQQMAAVDRQAVFNRKECLTCHLVPAFGKQGRELYNVACGICHDSPHRASMVPDLRSLKTQIEPDYYANIIAHGKPGTLMPAFASREGGPLDAAQVATLAEFLAKEFPRPVKTPGEGEEE